VGLVEFLRHWLGSGENSQCADPVAFVIADDRRDVVTLLDSGRLLDLD